MLGDGDDELDALRIVGRRTALLRPPVPDRRRHRRRHPARGARPAALRADELPARRRRAELPPVLRDQHAGRDPGRAARGVRSASHAGDRPLGASTAGWTGCGSTTRTAWPTRAATWTIWPTLIDHRYVLVEKIIEGDETLPASWACAGTTGYEALAALDRLFIDPAGEAALDDLDTQLRGGLRVDWPAMTRSTKRAVADGILRSEVLRLARLVPDVDATPTTRSPSCSAPSACTGPTCRCGAEYLDEAVERAVATRPEIGRRDPRDRRPAGRCRLRVLGAVPADLRHGDGQGRRGLRVLPVDPAHLADRGGRRAGAVLADPGASCIEVAADRLRALPRHHDRAVHPRHQTVGGRPGPDLGDLRDRRRTGRPRSARWNRLAPLGDGPLANLVWQAAVGAWPIERRPAARLRGEGGPGGRRLHRAGSTRTPPSSSGCTRWSTPSTTTPSCTPGSPPWPTGCRPFGWSNSLSAKLIQLTGAGRPGRLPGHRTVGPVAGRPGQPAAGRLPAPGRSCWPASTAAGCRTIDDEGAAKLLVTSRALRLRRDRPDLFTGYAPVDRHRRRPPSTCSPSTAAGR